MVRIFRIYYPVRTLVLLAGDALALILSFVAAVMLEYRDDPMLELQYNFGFAKILIVAGCALLLAHYLDLYSPGEMTSINETYVRLYALLGSISIALAVLGFVWEDAIIGNNTFFYGTVFATATLSGWRAFFTWVLSKNFMRERVYVLGNGARAQRLVGVLRDRVDMGMEIVGWSGALGASSDSDVVPRQLLEYSQKGRIDRVIVAMQDRRGRMPMEELMQLRLAGVLVDDATSLLEKVTGQVEVSNLTPGCLIFTDGFHVSLVHQGCMRIVSMIVAAVMLIVTSPLLLLIGLLIKSDSPGPAIFRQKRIGELGRAFTLFKFRSMFIGSEGPAPIDRNDPRFTRVGTWLRRTRLDELPQMWNVLKGDMNLVGPRPFVPAEEQMCAKEIPFYSLRWHVKPGITGWAQIRRGYNRTIAENMEKLSYDLFYIKNASLSLDLMIMFETAKILLLRRGSR